MSSIDNRIVQMQFENSQFEKGVSESLKSIEKLKKDLQFKDADKSLDSLRKLGDSFNLTRISGDIDAISQRFSALGVIGRRVLENIADGVYKASVSFAKDLSINNIASGFDKFTDKTKSVQTIMNATGLSIEEVDAQLSRLQWFTDETSYNFTDMVSNIGKFTSMGVDLGTSVTAMQGIANWAAVSGQGIQEAGRAMYNLSQAMGVGAVKLADWRSIELANMGTREFKNTVIETAKGLGVLNKESKTSKGTLVNLENFSSTLAEGWFSSDVLLKSLEKYGEYSTKVYEVAKREGIPASQAMQKVSSETMELGAKAFKAAQEYTNFKDTIVAVKDAVSTGWMETFEIIFGNYKEGIEVWTALGDTLYEIFATGVQKRNEFLRDWKEIGRAEFISGLVDALDGLVGMLKAVKTGFRDIFPQKTGKDIKAITDKVAEFGHKLSEAYGTYEKFAGKYNTQLKLQTESSFGFGEELAKGMSGADVKILQKRLNALGYGDLVEDGIFGPKTEAALKAFQESTGETIDGVYKKATHNNIVDAMFYKHLRLDGEQISRKKIGETLIPQYEEVFQEKSEAIRQASKNMFGAIKTAFSGISQESSKMNLSGIKTLISLFFDLAISVMKNSTIWSNVGKILKGVVSAFSIVIKVAVFLGKVFAHVISILMPFIEMIFYLAGGIGDAVTAFDQWLTKTDAFGKAFEAIKSFLAPAEEGIKNFTKSVLDFFGLGQKKSFDIKKPFASIKGFLDKPQKSLSKFQQLWEKTKTSFKNSKAIKSLTESFGKFKDTLKTVRDNLKEHWASFKEALGTKFSEIVDSIPDKLAAVTDSLAELVSGGLNLITPWIQKIPSLIPKLKNFWKSLTAEGDEKTGKKAGFLTKVKNSFKSLIDYLFGSGDVSSGKKPGIFNRVGKLLSGDLEGFTEGMDEGEKQKVFALIKGIQTFILDLKDAIDLLINGSDELSGDEEESNGIANKILAIRDFISKIIDAIVLLFTGDIKDGTALSTEWQNRILTFRNIVIEVFDSIKQAFGNIGDAISDVFKNGFSADSIRHLFEELWTNIKGIFESIGVIVSENATRTWENIKSFFENLWKTLKKVAIYVAIGGILLTIVKSIKWVKDIVGQIKNGAKPLSETILEFAEAIALIAVSFWLIGQLKPEQFSQAVQALTGIVKVLGGFLIVSGVLANSGAGKVVSGIAKSVMEIAIAIGILVAAIIVLQLVKWPVLISGIFKMIALMVPLGLFMLALSNMKGGVNVNLKGFYQIAIVIAIMALVVAGLGKLDLKTLGKGIGSLIIIMGSIAGLFAVLGHFKMPIVNLKGFGALAAVIAVMALVVAGLGILNLKTLAKGIGSLIIIMGSIAGLFAVLGHFKMPAVNLVGLLGLAAVIGVLGYIFILIRNIDPWVMLSFSISLAIALGAFIGACMLVGSIKGGSKAMLGGAASIAAAFDILVLIIGGLIGGIGYLDNASGGQVSSSIEKGGGVLRSIAEALVGFSDALGLSGNEIVALFGAMEMIGLIPGGALAVIAGSAGIGAAFDILVLLLGGLTTGLGALDEWSNGELITLLDRGSAVLTSIGNAIGSFVGGIEGGFKAKQSELQNTEMEGFAEAFSKFSEAVSGLASEEGFDADVEVAIKNAQALHDFFAGLEGYEIIIPEGFDFSEYATAASQLSTDMGRFGEGAGAFADAISGYSTKYPNLEADKDRAIVIAQNLHAFFSDLKAYKVEGNEMTGIYTAPGQLSIDMMKFGTAIASFSFWIKLANVNAGLESDTTIAIGIASAIKTFFDDIDAKTPDGLGLLNYHATILSYLSNVQEFGTTISDYNTAISGIAGTTITSDTETAITNASSIADFLLRLSTEYNKIETNKGVLDKWFTGDTTIGTVLDRIEELGIKIGSAASDISGIGAEDSTFTKDIDAAIHALGSFAGFLTVLSKDDIVVPDQLSGYKIDTLDKFRNIFSLMSEMMGEVDKMVDEMGERDYSQIDHYASVLDHLKNVFSGNGEEQITTENFLGGLDAGDVIQRLTDFTNSVTGSMTDNIAAINGSSEQFNTAGTDLANATMSGLANADVSGATALASNMQKKVLGYRQKFVEVGKQFASGLAKGIDYNKAVAVIAAKEVAEMMLEKLKEVFDSASPSRETAKIGGYFSLGLANGVTDKQNEAVNSASYVASSMLEAARGSLSTLSSLIAEGIDDNPVITPVVDLTNARLAAGSIGGMFGTQSFGVQSRILANKAVNTPSGRPVTANQNGTAGIVGAVNDMNDRIGVLGEAIGNMQMVVDSGALVGHVASKMDKQLGIIAMRKGRMG